MFNCQCQVYLKTAKTTIEQFYLDNEEQPEISGDDKNNENA